MNSLPKYVSSYRDRHGKTRYRYRKGGATWNLRGQPGTEEFQSELLKAAAGEPRLPGRPSRRVDTIRGYMVDDFARRAIPRIVSRAKQKHVPCSLTIFDIKMMMVQQNYRCAVSGVEFPLDPVSTNELKAFRPSVDRIQPKLGYVPGNVRIVCEIVNTAMNEWGEHSLILLVEQMATHLAHRLAHHSKGDITY